MMVLSEPGDYFIFKFKFVDVKKLVLFEDIEYDVNSTILKKEIRWGYEYLTYGKWVEYNDVILENQIDYKRKNIYIELKYSLVSGESVKIKQVDMFPVDVGGIVLDERKKYFKGYDKGNYKYGVKFVNIDWNPYDKDRVLRLYYQLSYITNKLFGIECYYFRYVPNKETKDVIFLEYVLYKVEDPVYFKVMVPTNTFTDVKYSTINLYGFQFDVPFIVHIDMHYFEEVFGKKEVPKVGDMIYFPYVNKMYEISGIEKNNIESYFQVGLNKWTGKRHVIYSDETEEFIDKNILQYEEVFKEEFVDNLVNVTDDVQLKPESIHNKDSVRSYFVGNEYINDYIINNLGTIISTKYYNIYKYFLVKKNYGDIFVKYNIKDYLSINSNYVFSYWIYLTQENSIVDIKYKNIEVNNNNIRIYYNSVMFNKFRFYKYLKIKKDNKLLLLEEIDRNEKDYYVDYSIVYNDENIEFYLNNSKIYGIFKYDLLSSDNIKMCFYDNEVLYVKIGNFSKYYILSVPLDKGKWIGCLFGLYFERNHIFFNFYTLNNNVNINDGKLIKLFEIEDNINNVGSMNDKEFYIKTSPLLITNIRIYNKLLNEEYYNYHLINRVIEDTNNYLLVDDCRIVSYASYIGNVK